MDQHRHFAHLVDAGAILGCARLALDEEVDEDRLPVRADQVEHQRNTIGVAGLGEAVEVIFGHSYSLRADRTSTRMLVCGWAERCHSVPSPLRGRDRERGTASALSPLSFEIEQEQRPCVLCPTCSISTPLPVPPPQGGREPCGARLRNSRNTPAAHLHRCVVLPPGRMETHHFIVGITNSAPSLMPEGQRAVTVLVLV